VIEWLDFVLRPMFAIASVAYVLLAVHVVRSSPQHANSVVAFLLVLVGALVAGSAFSYGTQDPTIYGIGRVLAVFASGFLSVAFYVIYRDYTDGPPHALVIAMLSVIPIATTLLALTNSMHSMIWTATVTDTGFVFTGLSEHAWFNRVQGPFMYGLFIYSAIGLAGRLPTIAPAHRKTVLLLLGCAILPLSASMANIYFNVGPNDFPFSAISFVVMLPLFAYAAISMRFYEFSPIAYQTLFDHVRDPIFVLDQEERIVCVNKSAQELLGGSERELIGRKLWEDFPEAREIVRRASELDLTQTLKLHKDHIYELSVGPLKGPKDQLLGMVVVCRNVTERRHAQSQLADSEHLIRTLIETSSNGILRFARDRNDKSVRFRCVFANRAAETYLGCGTGTLVGMPLDKLQQLNPERLIGHFADEGVGRSALSFETSAELVDGERWMRIVGEPVGDDFSVTLIDITQRKRNEDKMLADALRDPLTSVLNRRGFEKEGNVLVRSHDAGAVLYLDLNHFKSINDRFGHQAGDALLKAFGHRLEFCLRPEDILGRLGGDEFAIVLPGVSADDARHVADRLVHTASEAYIIQGQEIKCTASVGIALMPEHGEELWHLISVADQAMYDAKTQASDDAANDGSAFMGSTRERNQ
jgi:diguanylate cyclase (GGDEF)-like protein/PAS domain S-box-containing protein